MAKAMRTIPAAPAFVLEVLRANHRHQCSIDPEAEPDVELSFETTVAAWRGACDLLGTTKLAEALNNEWDLTISAAAWKAALEPPDKRTLRDVCDLIACQASRTEVASVGHFGTSSRSAGAFLAVRSLLLRAGANPTTVKPSLPIAEAARRFPDVFLGPISTLAPGRLPTVTVRTPAFDAALAMLGAGLLGLLALLVAGWLGFTRGRTEFGAIFAVLAGVGYVGTWVAARLVGPSEVRFSTITTFRDLAEAIAGERGDAPDTPAERDRRDGADRRRRASRSEPRAGS